MGNTKKGFTLVEILVVVSIIGILASFAFVTFSNARQNAEEKGILANMRAMQTHSNLYLALNGTYGTPQDGFTCDSGLFADPDFTRVRNAIVARTEGDFRCAAGFQGQTFAFRTISDDFGTLCVDNFSITRNDITWSASSTASCQ